MSTPGNGFYSAHLAHVNENNAVICTEDIHNQQGALLLKKGSRFNVDKARIIAQHKLSKPIEQSINIENSVSGKELYQFMLQLAPSAPGLAPIISGDENYCYALNEACQLYDKHLLLRQKLTVMSERFPKLYQKAIFGALTALSIGKELLSTKVITSEACQAAVIAALFRDVGFLHINPDFIEAHEITPEITRQKQAHPVIASKILEMIPSLPKSISEAALNHHESTDGTGYPKGKFGSELSVASQIVAISDTIIDFYARYAEHGEYTNTLISSALMFNQGVHFQKVHNAAARLVKRFPNAHCHLPENCPTHQYITERHTLLYHHFIELRDFTWFVLDDIAHSKKRNAIASLIGRMSISINSSGVLQPEYQVWLENTCSFSNREDQHLIWRSEVIYDEISMQLDQLKRLLAEAAPMQWKEKYETQKEMNLKKYRVNMNNSNNVA
ncbi:HD-GYP domain-containing protein [Marinibactrum halimedae]|uniref:HD-GYP domain-containing protein n=1 Tax=Marinibactrum halimedae TaxID=1444977 RepID=A0AA37T7T0_9GAMM|nr:HD domain-containing phosphohydrolase [Marinibactrum halimedae]MCD9459215.1 hypothetical protein [Marinibactrum halimedae]GLS27286.1 hypothetical protein GCM10007877_30050 [Marinibactrum halimedae]